MKKKIEMHSIRRKRMNTEVDQTKPVKKKYYTSKVMMMTTKTRRQPFEWLH